MLNAGDVCIATYHILHSATRNEPGNNPWQRIDGCDVQHVRRVRGRGRRGRG